MNNLVILVPVLRFIILFLLLYVTGLLCERRLNKVRLLLSAMLGGIYACISMIWDLYFLGNTFVNYLFFLLIGAGAFGFKKKLLITFLLLNLAMDGIVGNDNAVSVVAGVFGFLGLLCLKIENQTLLPVSLTYKGKTMRFVALRDTGNTLKDPLTGQSVLIVNSGIAWELFGLTGQATKDPVNSVGLIPGSRLIPYRTVGSRSGFMLAIYVKEVEIGGRKRSTVVAFAPEGLDEAGEYQALAGGSI